MEVVIITGLSGAGKTKAADWFEDQNYYCIDNMPPALIRNFIELAARGSQTVHKAAFVVDARGGVFLSDLQDSLANLRADAGVTLRILYLEASDEAIIRRYTENRRVHPLTMAPITKEIIAEERRKLAPLRDSATFVIDTSFLKVAEMHAQLAELFLGSARHRNFLIDVQSFGMKYGMPTEADMVLDVRFIPNPYYVASLRHLTGNNKKVAQYVLRQPITEQFLTALEEMLRLLIPGYMQEGKYSLRIAFGCTGGHHRSVAIANEVAARLRGDGWTVTLSHRDL